MKRQMLIDASHPEETRVVVLADKRLEEFDFEAVAKKQDANRTRGFLVRGRSSAAEPALIGDESNRATLTDYPSVEVWKKGST